MRPSTLWTVNFTVPGHVLRMLRSQRGRQVHLLKVLTGQIPQTSGSAQVLGMEVRDHGVRVRDMVGIVPEVESPPGYLTAYEFLYFVAQVRRIDDVEKRIDRWLKFFDLEDTRHAVRGPLKGMRQKVMLSAAFIHEPALFLDEPFVNMTPFISTSSGVPAGAEGAGLPLPVLPHTGECPEAVPGDGDTQPRRRGQQSRGGPDGERGPGIAVPAHGERGCIYS